MNYPPNENQIADINLESGEANGGADFALERTAENDIIYDNKINNKAEQPKNLSPRLVLVVFAILGFGTLLFGFVSLSNDIKNPFYTAPATEITTENNSTTGEQALSAAEIATLKTIDTDADGLSDYDETHTYKTSPYLADTDSDSYNDKQEIDTGHDPLCPSGRDCRNLETQAETQTTVELPTGAENLNTESGNATTTGLTEEEKNQLKQLSPAEVRQLLLESGKMTADQLGQISDEQLMTIFLESLR